MTFEPIIIDTTTVPDDVDDTIHVFTIDGVEYHMPAEPPGNVGLRFAEVVAEEGEAAATTWIVREMLGDDGYEALLTCRHLKREQVNGILANVAEHALASEDGQGNRASRRSASRPSAGRGSRATSTTSTPTSGRSTASRSRSRSKS